MQNTNSTSTGTTSQNNTGTIQIPPLLTLNFDELKREMDQFGQVFGDWVADKRRILTDDKENYLKTLAEEAGKWNAFTCALTHFSFFRRH